MRKRVKAEYPNPTWSNKVDCMTDKRVYCIYQSIIAREKKKAREARNEQTYHQMTLTEWEENK